MYLPDGYTPSPPPGLFVSKFLTIKSLKLAAPPIKTLTSGEPVIHLLKSFFILSIGPGITLPATPDMMNVQYQFRWSMPCFV